MKKRLLVLAAMATMSMACGVSAEEVQMVPGVTVAADENSPTGYTVTFVYEDAEAEKVSVEADFNLYTRGSKIGEIPAESYSVYDFEPGMFHGANYNALEMSKVEGTDYWELTVPMASGYYWYYYSVNDGEAIVVDPTNMPMASTAESGSTSNVSTFGVPYDEKQGSSPDYSYALPQEGVAAGEVIFADYTDVNGDMAPLTIYLPNGYDPEREESYKVVYASHGMGGNELDWFANMNAEVIFDNLIGEGTLEPTVLVTMNNSNYGFDLPVVSKNIMENVIPYVEENYNVATEPENRAFCGLSMGGKTTTYMYCNYTDQFSYFGMFSGADDSTDWTTLDAEKLQAPTVVITTGNYDFAYTMGYRGYQQDWDFSVLNLANKLDECGVSYDFYELEGGHSSNVWQEALYIFASEYLWK